MSYPSSSSVALTHPRNAARRGSAKATLARRQVKIWLMSLAVLVGVCFGSGIRPRPASAASVAPCSNSSSPSFCWEGGKVQHDPHVYLIFWGPKWGTDSDHQQIVNALVGVFDDFSGRQYTNILTQYGDDPNNSSSHFQNDTYPVTYVGYDLTSTPGSNLNPVDVLAEAEKIQTQQGWPNGGKDNQFLVFPQQGTTYLVLNGKDFCGYHADSLDGTFVYGLVRYASDDQGCQKVDQVVTTHPANLINDVVWTAVHEFTEMVTNPINPFTDPAWKTRDTSSLDPVEIADLCQQLTPTPTTKPPKTTFLHYSGPNQITYQFYLPYLWSNFTGSCVLSAGQEFVSPDKTLPFNGRHTVQGAILAEYISTALGGSSGLLGPPLTEEMPLAAGAVSYFAGHGTPCNGGGPYASAGAIYYSSITGSHEVHGCIYGRYQATCQQVNKPCVTLLGLPVHDQVPLTGGAVSYFADQVCSYGSGPYGSGSAIYYGGSSIGTHEVHGCIYYEYQHLVSHGVPSGGTDGLLGFPITDEMSVPGGRVSYFAGHGTPCNGGGPYKSGGAVYYNSTTAETHEVHGCIYQKYISLGGPTSKLGFPISDEYTNPLGQAQSDFLGGVIYYQNGTAVVLYY